MLRLIIVDDETEAREGLIELIDWSANGIRVVGSASDGRTALELIRQEKPDIVLIDIQMPSLSGLQVIQQTQEDGLDVSYVIVSGHDEFSYAQQACALHVHEYLLKPFRPQDVLQSVQRAIDRIEAVRSLQTPARESDFFTFYCETMEQESGGGRVRINYPAQEERAVIKALQSGNASDAAWQFGLFLKKVVAQNETTGAVVNCSLMFYMELHRLLMERRLSFQCNHFSSVRWDGGDTVAALKQALLESLSDVCRQINSQKGAAPLVRSAVQYINEHFREELTLDSVAKEVFASPAYLSSQFKQSVGVNFVDYIHQCRIDCAKQMLSTMDLSVSAVSEYVGYVSPKYFAQVFKKFVGITPAQFRDEVKSRGALPE